MLTERWRKAKRTFTADYPTTPPWSVAAENLLAYGLELSRMRSNFAGMRFDLERG
jgi:hypothetical protein